MSTHFFVTSAGLAENVFMRESVKKGKGAWTPD
jgi:hypothetical protein